MKKITILILLYFLQSNAFAQDNLEVGYLLSNTGEPIDNMIMLDPVEGEAIQISANSSLQFIKGYYINQNGRKLVGYIKRQNNSKTFEFKRRLEYPAVEIKIDNVKTYQVGLDSFVVMQDIQTVNHGYNFPIIKKPQFVLVNVFNDSLIQYQYYSGGSEEYFFEYEDKRYSVSDSPKENKELLSELFGDNPFLEKYLDEYKLKEEDISQFFDTVLNYQIYLDKDTLYYNHQLIKSTKINASYYAIIENFSGHHFTASYYETNSEMKIATGSFKSLNPMIRDGNYVWYHPKGKPRKSAIFDDNEASRFTTYFNNEKVHYTRFIPTAGAPIFEYIYNPKGELLVHMDSLVQYEMLFDSIRSRNITRKYKLGKLAESTVVDDKSGTTFTQKTRRNLKYPKINNDMWDHFKSILKYDDRMIEDEIQGTAYVRVLVNTMGKINEIEIIKGLDEEVNRLILKAFKETDSQFQIWKPAKNFNGKLINQEIVIPISFSIRSENIRNNYYFYDPFMFQQMYQINFDNIPVPQGF